MNTKEKYISLSDAASELSVSSATVQNWIRAGIILKKDEGILYSSVRSVKRNIETGVLNKLNLRANKTYLNNKTYPHELLAAGVELQSDDIRFQADKTDGLKSKQGSFYTPDNLIEDIIEDYRQDMKGTVCDPCCGTGRFLKYILGTGIDVKICGYDTDKNAVKIAKKELDRFNGEKIDLRHYNSLLNPEKEKFDFIFTNPPWGARYANNHKRKLREIYHTATTGDTLEYFLIYGLTALKSGGILSYILPESFLYVKKFACIRKRIAERTTIIKIKPLGRVFSKVFSAVIRIDIKKTLPERSHMIEACGQKISQAIFLEDIDQTFNITITENDRETISKIYNRPHITLKNNAEWSMGIVTGDNKRFVSNEISEKYHVEVITGKNIRQFNLTGNKKYMSDDFSLFQQVAKNNLFSAKEKLFYKFVSDRLVFAYDADGIYSINSANILIPKLKGYTIKSVMSILNSDFINFIYQKKFKSLKVLRTNLEKLPFPKNPDKKIIYLIDEKTSRIINDDGSVSVIRQEIENLIRKLFGEIK
ncbi:TPA: hypothetical protein DCR49_03005 [Candidatus Delongbacteria bacterium]|nr:hypothetical protein [Candidatus Delongbacteria bacterium]